MTDLTDIEHDSGHPPNELGVFRTLNSRGHTTAEPNAEGKAFIEFARTVVRPVLDIGAAFGVTTLPALNAGATVIANDIDERHLEILTSHCPDERKRRLVTLLGPFPNAYDFAPDTLAAVHASSLLNYLPGLEIESGVRRIFRWLCPGGMVYTNSGSPYAANLGRFVMEYDRRKNRGLRWPGEVHDLHTWSNDPTMTDLPEFLHLLEPETVAPTFEEAGFQILESKLDGRKDLPSYLRLDGRECFSLIARKP
jgi:polyketide synthase PksJ